MSAPRSGSGPDDPAGTWATETLPLAVRKELLERELKKLGFRKATAQGGAASHEAAESQRQGDAASSHPKADSDPLADHGD